MRTDQRKSTVEALLAAESATLQPDDIPADVIDAALDCIIDTLAVALGGSSDEVVRLVARVADGPGHCTRLTDGALTGPRSAALINGTAAHALDFDDWLPAAGLHPSAPLLPAGLAQAQAQAAADPRAGDGRRLLAAYVAGFEAQARIGAALTSAHYEAGFHPTATVGIFGAATAAAHVVGLEPEGVQRAWGLAATQAAGLRVAFGTMAKPLQAGRAAEAGLFAAQLAAAGATAPRDAVLGARGFAASHGQDVDPALATVPFADRWYLREVLVKRHAACFGTHAAIDGLLSLRPGVDPAQVREIELTVPELLRTVCAIPTPTTPLEGKFSLAFTAALALVRGSCQVSDFTDESVRDPELRSVTERVRLSYDESLPVQQTRVRVLLEGQQPLCAAGDSAVPATPQDRGLIVRDKFRALVAPALGDERCAALLAAIEGLPTGGHLAELTEALSPT